MRRLGAIIVAGLLGGVVVHILAVLAYPALGGRDLWSELEAYGPPSAFALVPQPTDGGESPSYLDPNMIHAICRTDLAESPHRVGLDLNVPFWSLGVFDRRGRSVYGLNSTTAGESGLDLLLIASRDLEALRTAPPDVVDEVVLVDLPADPVVVVLRAFVPDPTLAPTVAAEVRAAECASAGDLEPAIVTPDPLPGPAE